MQYWDYIFQSLHMSICQKACTTQWKHLTKQLLNFMFLISPNDKKFYSCLETSVGPKRMKILFTSYYQNISFRITVLSQKFQASFFLFMRSCWNFAIRNKLQKSSEMWRLRYCWCVANVFVCSRFYNFVAVFVNDSQNWDKS